jgi:hypothetical protein
MKLGMYIMAPEPTSSAYFINPSHQSVALIAYPSLVARQLLVKNFTAETSRHKNRRIVECIFFYDVRVVKGKLGD